MRFSESDVHNAPDFDPILIRDDSTKWLEALASGLEPGRFRYCLDGSLVPTHGMQAHMPTVFAVKVAWQIGIWESWPKARREACIAFLKLMQADNGYFVDPWLERSCRLSWRDYARILVGRTSLDETRKYYAEWRERNRRAETRQALSTLLMVSAKPNHAPPSERRGYADTKTFLDNLNWSDPWGAGSHLSHMLMLSRSASDLGADVDFENIKRATFEKLAALHHPKEGVWYSGEGLSTALKINGAMKVFSGLQWVEHDYVSFERLIDTILAEPFYSDGCHFTNPLFVLSQIKRISDTDYRREEIKERARLAAKSLMLHKKAQAGFSFNRDRSQMHYYTARTSRGLEVADIHGTTMFTWACCIIIELLEDEYPQEAKIWRAQVA